MAIPVLDIPYITQIFNISDPIDIDISLNWTGATSFEIASLPPDTSYGIFTTSIVGTATTLMDYIVFIRGINDDGAADWAPALWTTVGGASQRKLYGLSLDWTNLHPAGSTGVIFIKQATKHAPGNFSNTGVMLINDIGNDGNASIVPSTNLYSQIVVNGASDTYIRATYPGWEIIIDTAQAP